MANLFLTNQNLTKTIQSSNIGQDQKDTLLAKLPELNEQERLKLLEMLKETFLLDTEEQQAREKIQKNWQA